MKSRLYALAYRHRTVLKPLIPIRRPVRLKREGFIIYLRLDDWAVGLRIALRRRYEPQVTGALARILRPDSVFVDVGANLGYHTLWAAARLPEGRVIAFEPSEANAALLERSIEANRFDNVTLHVSAVADRARTLAYEADDSNGRVFDPVREPDAAGAPVPAVSLDEALAGEQRIDAIKMDIEGAEGLALMGMGGVLARHRPALIIELGPDALASTSGMSAGDLLAELRRHGYAFGEVGAYADDGAEPMEAARLLDRFEREPELHHLDLVAWPSH